MEAYTKVIDLKGVDADYAYYQKAMCYGFLSKNETKIEMLNSFLQVYPKSSYRDDAMYELANTYVAANKQDLALKTFDRLISEYRNGVYSFKDEALKSVSWYDVQTGKKTQFQSYDKNGNPTGKRKYYN